MSDYVDEQPDCVKKIYIFFWGLYLSILLKLRTAKIVIFQTFKTLYESYKRFNEEWNKQ